ncbi:MAG: hypothetical protein OSB58_12190 [Alphaproteobacteria bacterium]|jgi:hypothetical protein|nr:hypothetical protein [Alphaproteobacteria bacterium]
MTEEKSKKQSKTAQKSPAEQRQERLAKALRENLRRRKQQQVPKKSSGNDLENSAPSGETRPGDG